MSTSLWGPELLPAKAVFALGDEVSVELRGLQPTAGSPIPVSPITVSLWRDGELITSVEADAEVASFATVPAGRYGVEAHRGEALLARTAITVGESGMRYGFVADYRPGRDVAPIVDFARRLHLTDIQFYDWAYRHADLNGGGEQYDDALGQPVSLDTVARMVRELAAVGSRSLGYAAVYAVGNAEREEWSEPILRQADGQPWMLADFLTILDPSDPIWLRHFGEDLELAVERMGFAGFHLDQYGYPKRARRSDGAMVDLAEGFAAMIAHVRRVLPTARLVFNQVNDFPTWRTGSSPQDAVYVEVWPPHTTLVDLGRLTTASRRHGKPVVISAYLKPFEGDDLDGADQAAALVMATVFSHGGSHLLLGEADRLLTDPYYVRNHTMRPATAQRLRRWYDFLVENGDYLTDQGIVEVTGAYVGDYNGDLLLAYPDQPATWNPQPGAVWQRATRRGDELVIHLINLVDQTDTEWDVAKAVARPVSGGRLRVRPETAAGCSVWLGDPDGAGRLIELPTREVDGLIEADLPDLRTWQLVVVRDKHAH